MKIANIILHGNFTDGMAYQENCLPYYQHKAFGGEMVIISGPYCLEKGTNNSIKLEPGTYMCSNGLRLVRISCLGGWIGKKLAYLPELYEVLEKEKPDIIFAHLIQSVSILSIVRYKKRHPNVFLFGDSHADYINSAHGWISKRILHGVVWKMILRNACKYFECIYGVLPSRVQFLKEMYHLPDEKVGLLLMGAEDEWLEYNHHEIINDNLRRKLKIHSDDFVVITGGKIDENKNIKLLVDALDAIDNGKIILVIFGNPIGKMEEYIKCIEGKNNIRIIGWLAPKEIYYYFHIANICAFVGTHSVLWEQAVGFGLPGIFRYWEGVDHINCGGNIKFLYKKSQEELESILKSIIFSDDCFQFMKKRAWEIRKEFHYSSLALKSINNKQNCS